MPIWANHAHVLPENSHPDATAEKLIEYLDRCGIEKAVAFAPLGLRAQHVEGDPNEWLVKETAPWSDRLFLFGSIDVGKPPFRKQVQRIAELGMRGIKIHPPAQKVAILSDALMEVYAEAERLDLFISFHTGPHRHRLSSLRLVDFDEIAWQFPRLRFSLEHVGGFEGFRQAVGVIQNNDHRPHSRGKGTVYAGLTTVFTRRWKHYYLSPHDMEELVYRAGDDHVIFGMDFPWHPAEETVEAIKIINSLNISDTAKEKILGGTLRAQLGEV